MNRPRYTTEENTALIKFILDNQGKEYGSFEIFVRAASDVEDFKANNRTPHSLYQRFHKYLAKEKTNAAKLSDEQVLCFAVQYGVPLDDSVIKKLEDYFNIDHEKGLIKEYQITPKGLTAQFGQLKLDRKDEVREPHGAEVRNPDEAEEEDPDDAGEENPGEAEEEDPGEAEVVVPHEAEGEDPDGGKKEDPDKGIPECSNEVSNSLFEMLSCLIGCLNLNDAGDNALDDQFTSIIEMYFHKTIPPTRRVTQRHLLITIQAFIDNFNAPIQHRNDIVVFNGDIIRLLRDVHDSLANPAITRQRLLDAIAAASNRQIVGWRNNNRYPSFDFPLHRIRGIIRTIFAALQPEGFNA